MSACVLGSMVREDVGQGRCIDLGLGLRRICTDCAYELHLDAGMF